MFAEDGRGRLAPRATSPEEHRLLGLARYDPVPWRLGAEVPLRELAQSCQEALRGLHPDLWLALSALCLDESLPPALTEHGLPEHPGVGEAAGPLAVEDLLGLP